MTLSAFIPGLVLVLASRVPAWVLVFLLTAFAAISLYAWPAVAIGVALGYAVIVASGRWLLRHSFGVALLVEATGFWVLSNLGNWWAFFPHTTAGLVECFVAGLPFLGRAILIDGLVAGILWFGVARRLAPA